MPSGSHFLYLCKYRWSMFGHFSHVLLRTHGPCWEITLAGNQYLSKYVTQGKKSGYIPKMFWTWNNKRQSLKPIFPWEIIYGTWEKVHFIGSCKKKSVIDYLWFNQSRNTLKSIDCYWSGRKRTVKYLKSLCWWYWMEQLSVSVNTNPQMIANTGNICAHLDSLHEQVLFPGVLCT